MSAVGFERELGMIFLQHGECLAPVRFRWNALLVIAFFILLFGVITLCLGLFCSDGQPLLNRLLFTITGLVFISLFVCVLIARTRWLQRNALYTSFASLEEAVAATLRAHKPTPEDVELLSSTAVSLGADKTDFVAVYQGALARRASSPEAEQLFRRLAEAIFRLLDSQQRAMPHEDIRQLFRS